MMLGSPFWGDNNRRARRAAAATTCREPLCVMGRCQVQGAWFVCFGLASGKLDSTHCWAVAKVDSLELRVPEAKVVWHPPLQPSGKLPQCFLDELLMTPPLGYDEMGAGVQVAVLPGTVWAKLRDGRQWRKIAPPGRPGEVLTEEMRAILSKDSSTVPQHRWGEVVLDRSGGAPLGK